MTVTAVNEVALNVTADITYVGGFNFNDIKSEVYKSIRTYFEELNKTWADEEFIIIYFMQIGSELLKIKGIQDIQNIKINDVGVNKNLSKDEIIAISECKFNGNKLGE